MITADGNLNEILEGRSGQPKYLIEVLQDIQEVEGYIPQEAMSQVSERLRVRTGPSVRVVLP